MELPTGHELPTKVEVITLAASSIIAGLVALSRSLLDGKMRTGAARFAVVLAGALSGFMVGAVALSFKIDPLVAVAMSGLVGAAGEYVFLAAAKIGIQAQDDPEGFVRKITGKPTKDDEGK